MTTGGRAGGLAVAVVALRVVTLAAVGTALWTAPPLDDPVLRWLLSALGISCLVSPVTIILSASKRK